MGKLSHDLLDLGFLSALGTYEGFETVYSHECYVMRGTPKTWGRNNGVWAIYDEEGRPWVISIRDLHYQTKGSIDLLIEDHKIRAGAYVPHSNDGGRFMLSILPRL